MSELHKIHKTAAVYAVEYSFRLLRDHVGRYWLVGPDGAKVDCPATGETTAAGAIRMMRRHVRQGVNIARAVAS